MKTPSYLIFIIVCICSCGPFDTGDQINLELGSDVWKSQTGQDISYHDFNDTLYRSVTFSQEDSAVAVKQYEIGDYYFSEDTLYLKSKIILLTYILDSFGRKVISERDTVNSISFPGYSINIYKRQSDSTFTLTANGSTTVLIRSDFNIDSVFNLIF